MQIFYDSQIEVEDIYNKIKFYKNILIRVNCPYKRMFYEDLIISEIEKFIQIKKQFIQNNREIPTEREFTIVELAKYNGTSGNPAYVGVNGIVYDVSLSPPWGGGTHFGLYSGKDLTTQFKSCHNMPELLNNLPKVGKIKI